jgi:hypothetical protein
MIDSSLRTVFLLVFLTGTFAAATAQPGTSLTPQHSPEPQQKSSPAEDISGMYSFLHEGEFVQIDLQGDAMTGYISRQGDTESDHGAFLDQWFSKGAVTGHDVTFTTRPLHGVVFEFKGKFERGPAKTKDTDGYYVLSGTLTRIVTANQKTTSQSRQVEFKLLGQPQEEPKK